jgi:hypothetical protein
MLTLEKVQAKIRKVTPVTEKHGNEDVPAMSLSLMMALPAFVIDGLDKGLRRTMFRKPVKDEAPQHELEGVVSNDGMTKVLFPHLAPHSWTEVFTGYTMLIGSGLTTTDSEMEIEDVKVSKIRIEPKDGGSIVLHLSAHFEVDEKLAGALAVNEGKTIELSLIPPYIPH